MVISRFSNALVAARVIGERREFCGAIHPLPQQEVQTPPAEMGMPGVSQERLATFSLVDGSSSDQADCFTQPETCSGRTAQLPVLLPHKRRTSNLTTCSAHVSGQLPWAILLWCGLRRWEKERRFFSIRSRVIHLPASFFPSERRMFHTH